MLDIFAELSDLTEVLRDGCQTLRRIAEALERLSPPLPASPDPVVSSYPMDDGFHLAESPEEYQSRTDQEAQLAISLGVAPWSPAFGQAISQMRQDLMKSRMEVDAEGRTVPVPALSEEGAASLIRQAFQQAKAEANRR